MCDIKLNFFESKDPFVIGSLLKLYIDTEQLSESYNNFNTKLTRNYQWIEGKQDSLGEIKSHGGFVRLIGDNGIKAYILPKIKQLSFNKKENKEYIARSDKKYRIFNFSFKKSSYNFGKKN